MNLSMGLRVFMTETDEKIKSKADSKSLLQKAGWTEVRDLMGELSAHMSEKLHHSSKDLKGLNEKISNLGSKGASGMLKCISCARPVAGGKSVTHWSKNPLDPELASGAEAHVQRIKTAAAHLHNADRMPAIDGAQRSPVLCIYLFFAFAQSRHRSRLFHSSEPPAYVGPMCLFDG